MDSRRPMMVAGSSDVASWRVQTRELMLAGVRPDDVAWFDPSQPHLFATAPAPQAGADARGRAPAAPKELFTLAQYALCHRDASKWPVLYRLAWRLTHGERGLLSNATDPDVAAAQLLAKAVRRDAHKMKAFVRFRRVEDDTAAQGERFIAYHVPDHAILPIVAPFFARRFGVMHWTIMTPGGTATWDGERLTFGPASAGEHAPRFDALEDFWRTYYASVFNPARANPDAMKKEMPMKHWATLPEAGIIDELLRNAPARVAEMQERAIGAPAGGAARFVPRMDGSRPAVALQQVASAARGCEGCELYKHATQTVFGTGPVHARMMLVGEQPGDQEDVAGVPFVGPAGQLLDRALADAGIARAEVYLTNAVKHFKWEADARGKRRIHSKPGVVEVRACKPWLEREIGLIRPAVLVLLGATAAQSLLGAGFRVMRERGRVLRDTSYAPAVIATIHPSAVLRTPAEARDEQYAGLVKDLRAARELLDGAMA